MAQTRHRTALSHPMYSRDSNHIHSLMSIRSERSGMSGFTSISIPAHFHAFQLPLHKKAYQWHTVPFHIKDMYVGWSCVLNCFMLSSLHDLYTFADLSLHLGTLLILFLAADASLSWRLKSAIYHSPASLSSQASYAVLAEESLTRPGSLQTLPRGRHIHITWRSVCDQDQNGIKRSTVFLGADQGIKMNSEWLISTDQCTFSDT